MGWIAKAWAWVWDNLSRLALLGGWFVTIAAPAWAVSSMARFNEYAPASWIFAGLLGGVLAALGYALVAWGMSRIAHASAMSKWKEQVDTINPLDTEFHKVRIKLVDMLSPATNGIVGKKFTSCEILGPFDILAPNTRISNSGFVNCNIVVIKPGETLFAKHVVSCVFDGCTISGCTLYVPLHALDDFKRHNQGFPIIGDPAYQAPALEAGAAPPSAQPPQT